MVEPLPLERSEELVMLDITDRSDSLSLRKPSVLFEPLSLVYLVDRVLVLVSSLRRFLLAGFDGDMRE